MEFFNINIATVIIRFYLMMAVVIIGVFTAQYWLVGLALPIFLSVMLGLSIKKPIVNQKQLPAREQVTTLQKQVA